MGNGLRVLVAGRKSRKGDESSQFDRQEARNTERAERDGHTIVHVTRDVVSSQSMPWERKDLKGWMTEPDKVALYDGILVETDRLARCDDKGWHYIEHWCYENDKRIITTEGVQFPPRDDSDRYQWIGLKRRARTYWEDVRDKHAGTRELIKANGGAIGRAPFGYAIAGEKLRKSFVVDEADGTIAREAFQRIADGHTATAVAIWLSGETGTMWRVKRVTDMIRRRTYLGERDGHSFEPLVSRELWDKANAALATRSFQHAETGGRRTEHGYSGLIYCECGAQMYRHKSDRGSEKYRCGRGRRGDLTEARCAFGSVLFDEANKKIDARMASNLFPEFVKVTKGGDYGKQMELARIQAEMSSAMAAKDMVKVAALAAEFSEVDSRASEPVVIKYELTGKTYGQRWNEGNLSDRRHILTRQDGMSGRRLVMVQRDGEWDAVLMVPGEG